MQQNLGNYNLASYFVDYLLLERGRRNYFGTGINKAENDSGSGRVNFNVKTLLSLPFCQSKKERIS